MSEKEVMFGLSTEVLQKEYAIRNDLEEMDFGEAEGNDLRVLFLEEMQKDSAINGD